MKENSFDRFFYFYFIFDIFSYQYVHHCDYCVATFAR